MDFQVLDSGRTAALNAGIAGIQIEVTSFSVGSAFGYTVDPTTDTGLRGTNLWTGVPTGYSVIDVDTCEFLLELPGNVGTFNFGEVVLNLNNGAAFALASLPGTQQKIAQPGQGWNTVFIRARIQLVGVAAIIQWFIQDITVGIIIELGNYSLLPPPGNAPSNAYIVHDPDEQGNDPFVTRDSDNTWNVSTHQRVAVAAGDFEISAAGLTATTLSLTATPQLAQSFPLGEYLIQPKSGLQKGQVRKLTAVNGANLVWSPAFGAPLATSDTFEILQSTASAIASEASDEGFFQALSVRSIA
jgi:hypothetical protein